MWPISPALSTWIVVAAALIFLFVVLPAIWSRDPGRRAAALAVLDRLLAVLDRLLELTGTAPRPTRAAHQNGEPPGPAGASYPPGGYAAGRSPGGVGPPILRARIESGETTSRLPGERALQQEVGLAPVTIRKAVRLLRDEGLVRTVTGMGTYVVKR